MAGRQQELDFNTPFAERMAELRARLRSVEVAVTRLSPLRWGHVTELMMSIWAHTSRSGECSAPTERIRTTSGLSRNQYYRALAAAKYLGLVVGVPTYTAETRHSDRLRIVHDRLDELLGATRREQVRPGETRREQVRPGETTLKEHARALEELPKTFSAAAAKEPAEKKPAAAAAAAMEKVHLEVWEQARPIANQLLRAMWPDTGMNRLHASQREWVAKVALLTLRFGPQWIAPIFERLKHSPAGRSPQGLVFTLLDEECQRRGTRFNREMASVELPDSVIEYLQCATASKN
jgi:hypothetical protein